LSETASARSRRDERIADDAQDRRLMCEAHGCPNRWSVDAGGGRLCSAHQWSARAEWPRITQQLLDAETDRAYRAQAVPPSDGTPKRTLSRGEKLHVLGQLREVLQRKLGDWRAWAARLRQRHEAGENLTETQREMYRSALRMGTKAASDEDVVDAGGLSAAKEASARRVAAYLGESQR
jgi:hypothetical protein